MNNRPRTVLFISQDASQTGAPIFLLRFLRWYREHQAPPFRVLVGRWGALMPDFESLGKVDLFVTRPGIVRRIFYRLTGLKQDNSRHLEQLRRSLLDSNIGLIYSNTIVNGRILDFLSFLKCPVICHVHELDAAISNVGQVNLSLVKKHAGSFIAVSRAVKEGLLRTLDVHDQQVQVIHGFIPIAEDEEARKLDVRRELSISKDAKLVCACGSIEPRKGTDLFLEVANLVKRAFGDAPVHFVWVGGRPDMVGKMRKEVIRLSLETVVHFIGHRQDVGPYFEAADVFLLTSREDPFPLVMMEAALRGNPIICFDGSGGAPEFVEEDAGIVVPGFDVAAMADGVVQILSSEARAKQIGIAGKRKVLNLYDINIGAPRIAAVIENALGAPETFRAAGEHQD